MNITVRPLYLDTKLKKYITGPARDITDRVFVIRRAYRVNDSLPTQNRQRSHAGCGNAEAGSTATRDAPHRSSCRDLDPYYSDVSWHQDYAAYFGVADDGQRVSAIVAQITTKKPIYKKRSGSWAERFPTQSAHRRWGNLS